MSAVFALLKQFDEGTFRHVIGTVVFSGTYAGTGGDTLDLTNKGILAGSIPIDGFINGSAGFRYEWAVGTTLANGKVKIRINDAGGANAANAEHSNASVVAGVTGDTIKAHFYFLKE